MTNKLLAFFAFFGLLLVLFVAAGVRAYVPAGELRETFTGIAVTLSVTSKAVIFFTGLGLILVTGAGLAYAGIYFYSNGVIWQSEAEIRRAKAYQAKREASLQITVAAPGSQVILSELQDAGAHFRHLPGHLLAAPFNGEYSPTGQDVALWGYFHERNGIARPARITGPDHPQLAPPEPAPLPAQVYLRDYVYQPSLRAMFLGVGRLPGEAAPRPIIAPLDRLVHIATAGSSGFGKSTFMQALAYQALNAPDSRPVLMDAQGVTFSSFEGHPALLARLASDEGDILNTLDLLLDEMERRKGLFSHHPGVAKLRDYNTLAEEPLPVVPVFFDELGLLGDNRDVAQKVRLLVMGGRKFGVFMILGSQTWLASQFSTALRSNLSTSVQFAARDKTQSRVLLSSPEAANITLPGRAYAILPGQAGLVELQAPLVDETELKAPGRVVSLPDPATARAMAMRDSGASLSAIAREVLRLDREPNGRELRRVKLLLGLPE